MVPVCIIAVCAIVGGVIGYYSEEIKWEAFDNHEEDPSVNPPGQDSGEIQEAPDSTPKTDDSLTNEDRIKNTLLGVGIGVAVGGAIVATGGAIGCVATGSATVYIGVFGGTGGQTVAIGALAYDVWALVIAPFFGIEVEPIEYE